MTLDEIVATEPDSKQAVLARLCAIAQITVREIGSGGSVPVELVRELATRFGISDSGSMPEIAEAIAKSAGLSWDQSFDSRASKSGGGSTITLKGLQQLERAIRMKSQENLGQNSIATRPGFEIDIRPDASALKIFRNMSFTHWYAIGEFIDNSLTSAMKNVTELNRLSRDGYLLRVDVRFDAVTNSLTISDNAAGITLDDMSRAMKTSEPPTDTSVGLGLHGVGLKAAGFWFGQILRVKTFPLGDDSGWEVVIDLDDLERNRGKEGNGFAEVRPILKSQVSGTVIEIEKIWPDRFPKTKTPSTTRRYLSSIYREFLRPNGEKNVTSLNFDFELFFNGQQLQYEPPPLLKAPFWPTVEGPGDPMLELEWFKLIDIELATGKKIGGWVGILESMSRDLSGFFLHYRGKGIAGVVPAEDDDESTITEVRSAAYKPRRIFGQEGSYRDQSFVGEFDLSAFGKTITTDSPMWSQEEEIEFVDLLLAELRKPELNFWDQAQNLRRRLRSAKEAASDRTSLTEDLTTFINPIAKGDLEHGISQVLEDQEAGEEEFISEIDSYFIPDASGHRHLIHLQFDRSPRAELLQLRENHDDMEHWVLINPEHRSLEKIGPIQGSLEKLLTRLCLAIGVAEIFLDLPQASIYRDKFNEILDFLRRQS